MNRQAMVERVVHRKLAQIEREGGAVKDFFKGIIYEDYEIAIHNMVERAVHKVGELNLIPLSLASKIRVKPDEVFVDGRGSKYVVALDESTPIIGLSLLMSSGELLNKDKHSRALKKMMDDKGLTVYSSKDLRSKLERSGFGNYLVK